MSRHLRLYWETARRTSPGQLFNRALRLARRRIPGWQGLRIRQRLRRVADADPAPEVVVGEAEAEAWCRRLREGNPGPREIAGPCPLFPAGSEGSSGINWRALPGDRYCQFYLHGFPFAPALAAADSLADQQRLADLVGGWLQQCPPGIMPAWDPHPTARRIVNWVTALETLRLLGRSAPIAQAMRRSLPAQLALLEAELEYDLLGNHLITEAAALVVGGAYLRADRRGVRWYRRGKRILQHQAGRQILGDGCHYERSPMYHFVVLSDYLAAGGALAQAGEPFDQGTLAAVGRLAEFGRQILAPDCGFPLLNDSTYGYLETAPAALLEAAAAFLHRPDLSPASPDTHSVAYWGGDEYQIVRNGWGPRADYLVFDVGAVGPAENPGHGHADTLQVVWYHQGVPVLVDSGVSTYHDLPKRDWYRGTLAHNTPVVDGADSAELWDRFRFGRLPNAELTRREEVTTPWGVGYRLAGRHDGYRRLRSRAEVRRSVLFIPGGVLAIRDQVLGTHALQVTLPFHFHPAATLAEAGPGRLAVRLPGCPPLRSATTAAYGTITTAPYADRYGVEQQAPTWLLSGKGDPRWEGTTLLFDPTRVQERAFRDWAQGMWA